MARRNKQRSLSVRKQPQAATHNRDWKSSPIIVAAGSVAATVILSTTIFKEIVIPTQTARIEIEALKAKDSERIMQAKYESEREQCAKFENEIVELNEKINFLSYQLMESREGQLFQHGNPYPTELGVVRIGDSLGEIYKYFPAEKIEVDEKRPEEITVKVENSPFLAIDYSAQKGDLKRTIVSITFRLNYRKEYKKDFLVKKVIQSIGRPIKNPEEHFYRWSDSQGLSIYLLGGSYVLMKKEYQPAIWTE